MSNAITNDLSQDQPLGRPTFQPDEIGARRLLPPLARYGLALALVGAATILAFVADHLIQAPNLSLVFVLPVVVAAAAFGWGPALVAAVAGVLAFDFFFVDPLYSLAVANPTDLWALSFLLLVGVIVSAVAAQARRRALEAHRAADQARALQALAHLVLQSTSRAEVVRAAAETLARLFKAPAAVFIETGGTLERAALAGGAEVGVADEEAARLSLDTRLATRGEAYPVDKAQFDFWPVLTPSHARSVLAVRLADYDKGRPSEPERLVELVGAYLALALTRIEIRAVSSPLEG